MKTKADCAYGGQRGYWVFLVFGIECFGWSGIDRLGTIVGVVVGVVYETHRQKRCSGGRDGGRLLS